MKIILVLLLASLSIFAQDLTSKGNMSIGGKLSFSSNVYEKPSMTITIFDLSPEASLFLSNKLEAGAFFSFTSESEDYSITSIGIGPFINYYITENKIQPFIGASASLKHSAFSIPTQYSTYSSSNDTYTFSVLAGVLIPISKNLAVQPFVQRTYLWDKDIMFGDYTLFSMGFGIKAFL